MEDPISVKQTTSHILMIKPVGFDFNAETAVNNTFQQKGSKDKVQEKAAGEFENFVKKLKDAGVNVLVVQDTPIPLTPDSIFPNNWISFHQDGTLILYPMFAYNRRAERKAKVIAEVAAKFEIDKYLDFTDSEESNNFLEGTGSMVLDRENKIAYACLSPRTDKLLFEKWCENMKYQSCSFRSLDEKNADIYHTNVMMCVADKYVVICTESIRKDDERYLVINTIAKSGKKLVEINYLQMNRFAGNMLQVENNKGEKILVMSSQAYHALTADQIIQLEKYNKILHSDLTTIETNGGGSARCMMAEIFLPEKKARLSAHAG